ncbi:hypothetical protein [Dialister sp.]|uniref:hypothetical protein n=1 Tax=Dialister sp. TaxID=1955814 RepID=UPI002E7FF3F9|nr:hypothetical protein [Dialister sp.]MEE3452968.1 hypothetical protein [Dialister sp.]
MTTEELIDYLDHGHEIEFNFHGKEYSITQGTLDGKYVLSFCEFYKETTEVEKPGDILAVSRDGYTVKEMFDEITDEDIWIY